MAGLLRACLLFFIALIVLAVLSYHFFGIWGFLGFAALCMLAVTSIKSLVGLGLKNAFMVPFKAKSAVLKGARLAVHNIAPTTAIMLAPSVNNADEDDGEGNPAGANVQYDWFSLDITISPKPPSGSFQHWEPGELIVVGEDAKEELEDRDNETGTIAGIEIFHDGVWQADEGFKFVGEQRLRLQTGLAPGVRRFKLRYYFELLGPIEVPGRSEASSAVIDQ